MARANERIAQHLNRPRHLPEGFGERASHLAEQTGELVRDNPWTSAATTFAAGLGVGLTLALVMFRPQPKPPLHHGLTDAVLRALPDALRRYFS